MSAQLTFPLAPAILRVAVLLVLTSLVAACGGDGTGTPSPGDSSSDGSSGMDSIADADGQSAEDVSDRSTAEDADADDGDATSPSDDDVGDGGTGASDSDSDAGTDVADGDSDESTDGGSTGDGGTDPPPGDLADYIVCEDDIDCPVGYGTCVRTLTFNRTDADGTSSVRIADLPGADGRAGVCSVVCTSDSRACEALTTTDSRGTRIPWSCQLVATGASPYGTDFENPTGGIDPDEMERGQPFAALCRPPFQLEASMGSRFCRPCDDSQDCPDGLCWDPIERTEFGPGFCSSACGDDDRCPVGFICEQGVTTSACVPVLDTCSACRDLDSNGFGTGLCQGPTGVTPYDCNDLDPRAFFDPADLDHPFPETCSPFDFNCNGLPDDQELIGNASFVVEVPGESGVTGVPHCTACGDLCGGARPNGSLSCLPDDETPSGFACTLVCNSSEGSAFRSCDGSVETGCETDFSALAAADITLREAWSHGSPIPETALLYADCDGDGFGDPNMPLLQCPGEEGNVALLPCSDPASGADWVRNNLDCDDSDPTVNPDAEEVCDGIDNNCSGTIDFPDRRAEGEVCPGYDPGCDPAESRSRETLLGLLGQPCEAGDAFGECRNGTHACSTDEGVRCVAGAPSTVPDRPSIPSLDTNCDGMDGDEARAVFVSPLGSSLGNGTRAQPIDDINLAVELAGERGHDVYLAQGDYVLDSALVWEGDVGVFGGFRADFLGERSMDPSSTRLIVQGPLHPRVHVGLLGELVTSGAELQMLTIEVPMASTPSTDAIAMMCRGCDSPTLRHVVLIAGHGTDGAPSLEPQERALTGTEGFVWPSPGFTDRAQPPECPSNPDGTLYAPGYGGGGGPAGLNGGETGEYGGDAERAPGTEFTSYGAGGGNGQNGRPAVPDGGPGSGGLGGRAGDSPEVQEDLLVLVNGIPTAADGPWGIPGQGGGGGGGGGGASGPSIINLWANGGGGGSGGCGGRGGSGGQSGGSSLGLVLTESNNVRLEAVSIRPGRGGHGASGGPGQPGGHGGEGAEGLRVETIRGGDGGKGGGGAGGGGGSAGNGGHAWAVVRDALSSVQLVGGDNELRSGGTAGSAGESGGEGGSGGEGRHWNAEVQADGDPGNSGVGAVAGRSGIVAPTSVWPTAN